jgi:two-component system, NtrC family, response regulator AtoC
LRRPIASANIDDLAPAPEHTMPARALPSVARCDVLLVEDDEGFAYALSERLRRDGLEVVVTRTVREALHRAAHTAPTLSLIDCHLPDGSGLDVARALVDPSSGERWAAVMITAFGSIDDAVEAMRSGCLDYVSKDKDLDEISLRVRKAIEVVQLSARVRRLEHAVARGVGDAGIDGTSAAVTHLREQIALAASAPDTTVLVEGETGTGKQLVARAIHCGSSRGSSPYVEVDCTTLAAGLFESELFGHERGAFTSAAERKLGLVEMATGGTLVLDEIGELDLANQAKLLRLLQERRYRRVGSVVDRVVDARFIASTNRVLSQEVAAGRFRQDLYYRLRVLYVGVPPLRERNGDVLELAERFVREFGKRLGKPGLRLAPEAIEALGVHPFPGNVRELRAVVEQAVVRATGPTIDTPLLGIVATPSSPWRRRGRPKQPLSDDDASRIREALDQCAGNQSRAAEMLGLSRFALKRRLKRL